MLQQCNKRVGGEGEERRGEEEVFFFLQHAPRFGRSKPTKRPSLPVRSSTHSGTLRSSSAHALSFFLVFCLKKKKKFVQQSHIFRIFARRQRRVLCLFVCAVFVKGRPREIDHVSLFFFSFFFAVVVVSRQVRLSR